MERLSRLRWVLVGPAALGSILVAQSILEALSGSGWPAPFCFLLFILLHWLSVAGFISVGVSLAPSRNFLTAVCLSSAMVSWNVIAVGKAVSFLGWDNAALAIPICQSAGAIAISLAFLYREHERLESSVAAIASASRRVFSGVTNDAVDSSAS